MAFEGPIGASGPHYPYKIYFHQAFGAAKEEKNGRMPKKIWVVGFAEKLDFECISLEFSRNSVRILWSVISKHCQRQNFKSYCFKWLPFVSFTHLYSKAISAFEWYFDFNAMTKGYCGQSDQLIPTHMEQSQFRKPFNGHFICQGSSFSHIPLCGFLTSPCVWYMDSIHNVVFS